MSAILTKKPYSECFVLTYFLKRCIISLYYSWFCQGGLSMTEYLKAYMQTVSSRLNSFSTREELEEIFLEHKDKIGFMQHERIVHFLVTMLFALILTVFISVLLFTDNVGILLLVTIILVLLGFYIKHYYFLENTVQKMYRVYDEILLRRREMDRKEQP